MGKEKRKKPCSSPAKDGGVAADVMFAIGELTDEYVSSVNTDIGNLKGATEVGKVKDCLVKFLKGAAAYQQKMSSQFSDLCKKVAELEEQLDKSVAREAKANEKIESMERIRESMAVKASRAEMTAKIEQAVTQVKILDLSLDTQTDDRRELTHAVKCRLKAKVKADDQPRYQELVDKGVLQVLANKSTKRKRREDGQEIWTAPVLITIPDKETRWEMEDLLRRNRLFPTFHWPKEFLDPMKKMREELKKKVDEDKNYVRIRPFQSAGKWLIKADIRAKEGNDRFTTIATWEVPPLDAESRKTVKDWYLPHWVSGSRGGAGPPYSRGAAAAAPPEESEDEDGMEP